LIEMLTDDPAHDFAGHYLTLYSIARFLPIRQCVEIGCDDGSSTIPLLLGGAFVHSVDIAPCREADRRIRKSGLRPGWQFYQMPSLDFATRIPAGALDCVLIDGDHSEDVVRADWHAYRDKVRVGGFILLHDATSDHFPGVARVVAEEITPDFRFEVLTFPWSWGLTCARRIA
jgi:predicted O-methyltransferase YrrM